MPHTRSTTPKWDRPNLRDHHVKHAACFADIKGLRLEEVSEGRFEIYSDECYEDSWLRYEADCRHDTTLEYVGLRHYFVNDDLAVAITTRDEGHYISFFHEHFDRTHGLRPASNASVGQRQLEYRKQLAVDVETTKTRSLKLLPNP